MNSFRSRCGRRRWRWCWSAVPMTIPFGKIRAAITSLYNPDTDEVFLADPGGPDRNRTWIPLRYVYDALKTSSQYQYLLVKGYEEENNLWKQDGIDEAWVEPAV